MRTSLFAVLWIGVVALVSQTPLYAVEETFEVTGKILKVRNGNATTVTISVPEEGDVPISNQGKGKELLKHIGATVEVTGRFSETEFAIDVISYKIKKPD